MAAVKKPLDAADAADAADVAPTPTAADALNAFVAFCAMVSIYTNARYGKGLGNLSCQWATLYSPSSPAFSIWGLIYGYCGINVVTQFVAYDADDADVDVCARTATHLLYSGAWLLASLWTPLFVHDTVFAYVSSAIILVLTAVCACGAAYSERAFLEPASNNVEIRRWLVQPAYSLLAGWTVAAAAVNIGIAANAANNKPSKRYFEGECDVWQHKDDYPYMFGGPLNGEDWSVVPVLLSLPVCLGSLYLRDAVLPCPLLWAIYWMPPSVANVVGFVLLGITVPLALGLAYFGPGTGN